MAKLYELTSNYLNLMELLDNPEVPGEVLQESLQEVKEEIEIKAENIAKLVKNIDSDIQGLKAEEKRLNYKRKSLENKQKSIKQYLEDTLKISDIKKVKTPLFTITIQKNAPSVVIEDLESIPECYFLIKKEISKSGILEALKAGQKVVGAKLEQKESLRIR